MSDVTREEVVRFAEDLERSATGMMRASKGALEDGDKVGAQRQQIIAVREYAWAEGLWRVLGQRTDAERCQERAEAVRLGTWTEPTTEPT